MELYTLHIACLETRSYEYVNKRISGTSNLAQLWQSIILRFVIAVFLAPALHRIVDFFIAEPGRADTPIMARIFLGVNAVEKFAVRVRQLAAIIFCADLHRVHG